ncbi:hypothetical protein ACE38W_14125 [Chitinophaga sp. Hz27]|uniref:hypothetical protein n=1 Tax=Chitinophaga sp. Hz27 TaxID=3347169 RepID=UPI0035E29B11
MVTSLKNLSYPAFIAQAGPALDTFLQTERSVINGHTIHREQALEDMHNFIRGEFPIHWVPTSNVTTVQISNACIAALITCSVDILAVMFQLLGLPEEVTEDAAEQVMKSVPAEELSGLEQLFKNLADADSMTDKAKAMFAIFAGIYKVTGIRQILGAIEHNMAWYEWVIMGATISAQIVAWIATDGVAAVAELVLLTAAVGQAVADAVLAVTNCAIN